MAAHIIKTIKLKRLTETKLYGTLEGEKFRIVVRSDKEDSFVDKRKVHRGKVCTYFSIPELIGFLYYYGKTAPLGGTSIAGFTKEVKVKHMLGLNVRAKKFMDKTKLLKMSDDKLSFYYGWYSFIEDKRDKKKILCEYLRTLFEKEGRLI